MTPRPAADLLEEAVAILLRIERILTREADNATVDYYVRRLSQPQRHGTPVRPGVVQHIPGMPDPPLPKVQTRRYDHDGHTLPPQRDHRHGDTLRPQTTTWGSRTTCQNGAGNYPEIPDSSIRYGWVTPPPSYMHGRFLHGEDVMVGP